MTTRYRKRPVEVRAVRWTGENASDITDLTGGHRDVFHDESSHALLVSTSEGRKHCMAGDWLIREEDGQYEVTSNTIFTQGYEAIDVLEVA
jgi:hypothetical protein